MDDTMLVEAARAGDEAAFATLVRGHRRELLALCYRMLGSAHDADDALQEAMLGAWRGLSGFRSETSFRRWLYHITTNACLRQAARRPKRVLSFDLGPARVDTDDLGEVVTGSMWIEPWPDDIGAGESQTPESMHERQEGVELAFVAALQHLPVTQRAALILRDVLGFSASDVARDLDTTPAAVNSALQRARGSVAERVAAGSQGNELDVLGEPGRRQLVESFVAAWEGADVPALVELLAEDVRLAMPPLPAWFDGRTAVVRFFRERVFAMPWRLVPCQANSQLAVAAYPLGDDGYRLGGVSVIDVRAGRVSRITSFLDPSAITPFGLPAELLPDPR